MSITASRPPNFTRRSPSPVNASTSPINPFANLDPNLHPVAATLNSVSASASAGASHRSVSPPESNRLTDFAQHVLGGAGQDDAENLLAFTAGEDGLFHGADGTHFEGLLESAEAEAQAERERARTAEGREAGFPAEDGDGLPLEEATAEQQAEVAGAPGRPTRKRRRDGDEHLIGENGEHLDPTRVKKDSHKEVERRRRETINDGIAEIARQLPGGVEKMGKGSVLRRAAEYLAEIAHKVQNVDQEIAKREAEKEGLQSELKITQQQLAEEHARSMRYETSWREAEDRAASSQFELERVKAELDELKARQ